MWHDTVWMGVDRAAMNRQIFEALKPGGVFIVIDHAGRAGTGINEAESLHRIEAAVVEREVEAAGFRLVRSSSLLANPLDDRTDLQVRFSKQVGERLDKMLGRGWLIENEKANQLTNDESRQCLLLEDNPYAFLAAELPGLAEDRFLS